MSITHLETEAASQLLIGPVKPRPRDPDAPGAGWRGAVVKWACLHQAGGGAVKQRLEHNLAFWNGSWERHQTLTGNPPLEQYESSCLRSNMDVTMATSPASPPHEFLAQRRRGSRPSGGA